MFREALSILTDPEALLHTIRQTMISINYATSHSCFVDRLDDDLLSVVFETAKADQIMNEGLREVEKPKAKTKIVYFQEVAATISRPLESGSHH